VGLLDDAIREHLELKRAHGASAEEIDHLAQEALGPVKREVPEPDGGEPVAVPDEHEPLPAEDPLLEAPVAAEPEPEPEPDEEPIVPSAEELDDATPAPESAAPAWELTDEELEPEDEPEAAIEEHEELEGEDVLEETPEFLQETPEHDRLWFEQKPPRDFDFDR
jgi:hypothetical protein